MTTDIKLPLERLVAQSVRDDDNDGVVLSNNVEKLELAYTELQERCAKAEEERDEARTLFKALEKTHVEAMNYFARVENECYEIRAEVERLRLIKATAEAWESYSNPHFPYSCRILTRKILGCIKPNEVKQ